MAKETGAAAPTTNDDFDAAFAQFSTPEGETAAAAAPAADAATTGGDQPAAAAEGGNDGAGDADKPAVVAEPGGAAEPGAGDTGAAPVDDKGAAKPAAAAPAKPAEVEAKPAVEAPAAEAPAAAATPDADAILDRLGKLVAAAEKPAEPAAPAAAAEPTPTFSKEQQEQIANYEKDWPDVAKFEAMKRTGEYKELLGYVFAEVQKYVQPLRETMDALAGRTHLQDITTSVPDYSDNLRQQVIDWAGKQPAYLQAAYNHVIQNGTVDEVKDLVDRYRQATGQAAPAAGAAITGQQAQAPVRDNELSGAAKEAAAALAPVESKRSEVLQPGDPSNFDDAWKQFADTV